jgi:hypothetical protein
MPRGGKRPNAGRRKDRAKLPEEVLETPGFATSVLGRIGELELKDEKGKLIKSAEDYQLQLLASSDIQTRSFNFNRLVDRKFGKPAQGTFQGDTRESGKPLERGNLPSHFEASRNPAGSDKPN